MFVKRRDKMPMPKAKKMMALPKGKAKSQKRK
jgi:hypothetical protein